MERRRRKIFMGLYWVTCVFPRVPSVFDSVSKEFFGYIHSTWWKSKDSNFFEVRNTPWRSHPQNRRFHILSRVWGHLCQIEMCQNKSYKLATMCRMLSWFFSLLTNLRERLDSWEPCHLYVYAFSLIPLLSRSPILSHCLGGGVITQ